MAPTMMKMVPSGKEDVCMKGAFAVGGTEAGGYEYAPLSFGRPVRAESEVAALPVIEGTVAAAVVEAAFVPVAVMEGMEVLSPDVAAVVDAAAEEAAAVAVAEERAGRASVAVVSARTPCWRAANGARRRGRALRLESLMVG